MISNIYTWVHNIHRITNLTTFTATIAYLEDYFSWMPSKLQDKPAPIYLQQKIATKIQKKVLINLCQAYSRMSPVSIWLINTKNISKKSNLPIEKGQVAMPIMIPMQHKNRKFSMSQEYTGCYIALTKNNYFSTCSSAFCRLSRI